MRVLLSLLLVLALLGAAVAQPAVYDGRLVGPPDRVAADSDLTYPLDLDRLGIQMPRIEDNAKLDRLLHGPTIIYYKLPQCYQLFTPASRTEHRNLTLGASTFTTMRANWGLFKTSFLSEFNANPDFPWETTIGLNVSHREAVKSGKPSPYDTVNFLALPTDSDGKLIPVLVLADTRPVQWIYPPGTVVGEVIFVTHEGRRYVQEVRTRTKSAESKTWFPGVFRPVRDRQEFMYLTGLNYEPARKFLSFRNPEEDEVFAISGTVEKLPNIPAEVTKALLARPFQDVTQVNWSPMAEQEFSILPKDYSFGLFRDLDSKLCAGCHRQTAISVRNLIPREPLIINNPQKVGNIRGCDAVFTWYPFARRSIRSNDLLPPEPTLYVRAFDVRNGSVQVLHRGQTPDRDYRLTLYVQESLKPYELPPARFLHTAHGIEVEDTGDGLGRLDRRLLLGPQTIAPAPVETVLPTGLRWEFREGDPAKFYRDVLVRSDGTVAGVYDTAQGVYRPLLANQKLGAAMVPPVPVPEAAKARR
jgi:hypothetical protein